MELERARASAPLVIRADEGSRRGRRGDGLEWGALLLLWWEPPLYSTRMNRRRMWLPPRASRKTAQMVVMPGSFGGMKVTSRALLNPEMGSFTSLMPGEISPASEK